MLHGNSENNIAALYNETTPEPADAHNSTGVMKNTTKTTGVTSSSTQSRAHSSISGKC